MFGTRQSKNSQSGSHPSIHEIGCAPATDLVESTTVTPCLFTPDVLTIYFDPSVSLL